MQHPPITPDAVFRITYPFVRKTVTLTDEDGSYQQESWAPGRDKEDRADGEGLQVLTVHAVCHLGGRYQDRVFYVQQWQDPDGKTFGKTDLRVCGLRKFRSMTQGYRFRYALPGQPSVAEQEQAEYDAIMRTSYAQDAEMAAICTPYEDPDVVMEADEVSLPF